MAGHEQSVVCQMQIFASTPFGCLVGNTGI